MSVGLCSLSRVFRAASTYFVFCRSGWDVSSDKSYSAKKKGHEKAGVKVFVNGSRLVNLGDYHKSAASEETAAEKTKISQ